LFSRLWVRRFFMALGLRTPARGRTRSRTHVSLVTLRCLMLRRLCIHLRVLSRRLRVLLRTGLRCPRVNTARVSIRSVRGAVRPLSGSARALRVLVRRFGGAT
jgi:hypothetical protein